MSKRVNLSRSLKRKLKTHRIEKEKLLPRISVIFSRDVSENNTSFSTPAKTIDIARKCNVSRLFTLRNMCRSGARRVL